MKTYDKATIRDIQRKVGATEDGIWGPETVSLISDWAEGTPPICSMSADDFSEAWGDAPVSDYYAPAHPPTFDPWDIRAHMAADPGRAYLCDISHYQGEIDYRKYAACGISGTIMRTTIGVHSEDKRWRENWKQLRAIGHPVGAYHLMILLWNGKPSDPRESAESFVRKVKGAGSPDIGYWGDAEHSEVKKLVDAHGKKRAAQWVRDWLLSVEEFSGEKPRLYSSARALTRLLGEEGEILRPWAMWWAAYVKSDDSPLPLGKEPHSLPSGWSWLIWQYSSNGKAPGIESRRIDLNVLACSRSEFRAYLGSAQ